MKDGSNKPNEAYKGIVGHTRKTGRQDLLTDATAGQQVVLDLSYRLHLEQMSGS